MNVHVHKFAEQQKSTISRTKPITLDKIHPADIGPNKLN